jgi:hypothetical protein
VLKKIPEHRFVAGQRRLQRVGCGLAPRVDDWVRSHGDGEFAAFDVLGFQLGDSALMEGRTAGTGGVVKDDERRRCLKRIGAEVRPVAEVLAEWMVGQRDALG